MMKSQPVQEKLIYTARVLHDSYPDVSIDDINYLLSSFLARAECVRKYEPSCKVKAATVLVRTTKTKAAKNLPHDYGLAEMCEDKFDIIEVEGGHNCFYENPLGLGLPDIGSAIFTGFVAYADDLVIYIHDASVFCWTIS
ncbi:unnamed protein product [Allacma fusca]|uniref:Uncharacterized protein n=1 Tax=Allacma fusca TaxID=39272 RepID=A0A8J2PDY5_9HEXA|nr:unnamed protein product [Allacma fusca]